MIDIVGAGLMKICCWNGSGSDEKNVSCNGSGIDLTNVAEMEAGVMKKMFPEIQAELMKLMLLKWKLEWWKYVTEMEAGLIKRICWTWSGYDETNFAEMKAGLMKNVAEMEAGVVKKLRNWKRNWWKECCWNGSRKFYKINIWFCDELSATNCPATNCDKILKLLIADVYDCSPICRA